MGYGKGTSIKQKNQIYQSIMIKWKKKKTTTDTEKKENVDTD